MKFNAELTDTYCGEANYSWVRRVSFELPDSSSDLAIVRKAKALLDVTGTKVTRRENHGDLISLWGLDGNCVVLFISAEV